MSQLEIKYTGKQLKEKGIKRAVQHADRVHGDWSEQAYHIFKIFLNQQPRTASFKVEQFREYAKDFLVEPPSLRAFGSLVIRAKKENLIRHVGFTQVENPKAHHANASLWQRV